MEDYEREQLLDIENLSVIIDDFIEFCKEKSWPVDGDSFVHFVKRD